MSTVRGKFRLHTVTQVKWNAGESDIKTLEFSPVIGPGNETWAKATPGGKLTMTITNAAALDLLKLGSDYWLDLTEVEAVSSTS